MIYSTEHEEKSSIVERWNRTMKNIMWKYFTGNNTQKYIDVLPGMVEKHNSAYHLSIKMTPSDARNPASYQGVHNALYAKIRKATPKFHVGDKVRITRNKGIFEKGFTPNWTEEVFTISSVRATNQPTHIIKDTFGEQVQGIFSGALRHSTLFPARFPLKISTRLLANQNRGSRGIISLNFISVEHRLRKPLHNYSKFHLS